MKYFGVEMFMDQVAKIYQQLAVLDVMDELNRNFM